MMSCYNRPKLNDIFINWLIGKGIFYYLSQLNVPWKDDIPSNQLDLEYHGNYSGNKPISVLLKNLDDAGFNNIEETCATVIFNMHILNWNKLYETLKFEYNPINNYDMTETGEDINNGTTDNVNNNTYNSTNTGSRNGSRNQGVYGFNSSDSVNSDNSSYNDSDNFTDSGEDKRTINITNSNTLTHTLTRSGNIGVTTSQQMIESERSLWVYNFIKDTVFKDIDSVLTLLIY